MRKTKQAEIDYLNEQIRLKDMQIKSQKETIQSLSDLLRQAKEELSDVNPDPNDGTSDISDLIFCIDCEIEELTEC